MLISVNLLGWIWRLSVVSRRKMGVVIAVSLVMVSAVLLVFVNSPGNPAGLHYTFSIVNIYPHDANAFTQGLVFMMVFFTKAPDSTATLACAV